MAGYLGADSATLLPKQQGEGAIPQQNNFHRLVGLGDELLITSDHQAAAMRNLSSLVCG